MLMDQTLGLPSGETQAEAAHGISRQVRRAWQAFARGSVGLVALAALAHAGPGQAEPLPHAPGHPDDDEAFSESGEDINYLLQRATVTQAIFRGDQASAPRRAWGDAKLKIEAATGIAFGADFSFLAQGANKVESGAKSGGSLDMNVFARWHFGPRDAWWRSMLVTSFDTRVQVGETVPGDLGKNIGSILGTAYGFNRQPPTVNNVYIQTGSRAHNAIFRVGRFDPRHVISTSRWGSPKLDFVAPGILFPQAIAYPTYSLGAALRIEPARRFHMIAMASDNNQDVSSFGNPFQGQYFAAVEAGFSSERDDRYQGRHSLAAWQTSARPEAGITESWGVSLKLEQEIPQIPGLVLMGRYAHSEGNAAKYRDQGVLYAMVPGLARVDGDLAGLAVGLASPVSAPEKQETLVEAFWRLPVLPGLEATLDGQLIFNPAESSLDGPVAVLGLRLRSVF
jgi:hypothetical protein